MPGGFEKKLQECQHIYLHADESKDTNNKTEQLMEGVFDGLNKLNQKVKSARQAYDSGGVAGLADNLSSDYKKQWNMMTPEQKAAYDQDFKKYEAYMKGKAMDAAHVQKADVHYNAAWQQVDPASRQKHFDNSISVYAQAARDYEQHKKNDPAPKEWANWLTQVWPNVKRNNKSINRGSPFKQQKWDDLQPAKQQSLTTAGWDKTKWDAMVSSTSQ